MRRLQVRGLLPLGRHKNPGAGGGGRNLGRICGWDSVPALPVQGLSKSEKQNTRLAGYEMTDIQGALGAIVLSAHRFPNCPIANCDCNHKGQDEWKKGCFCMCHFFQMDRKFGKNNWNLGDVGSSARAGRPRRKPGPRVSSAEGKDMQVENTKLAGARRRKTSNLREVK